MKMWSRRFKHGQSRYMTRAFIERGDIIITQNERMDNPTLDYRNEVILSLDDFRQMLKTLDIKEE